MTTTSASAASAPASPSPQARALASAASALTTYAAQLHATPQDKFALSKSITGLRGIQYLTYNRTYAGIPVHGGDVVISTDASGQAVEAVSNGIESELQVANVPKLTAAKAAATARAQLAKVESVSTPKLVVHALLAKPTLTWETVVTGAKKDNAPSVLHVFVDAATGKVVDSYDDVKHGTGNGYYVGQVNIATSGSAGSYSMTDNTRPGLRCGGQGGTAYTKSTDSWGNGQGTNLETACVDTMYAAQKESDMLKDWLGRNGINGSGGAPPARVGLADVNAYWNGSYTNFGHSQDNQRQATSMDVVAHEYGHAIDQYTGSTGSGGEGGGLGESTGDIFGALTEYYANNPNDPGDYTVGEKVNLVGSGPIRYMYNPQTNGDPNCWTSAIPNTEVHKAAGPQNHWFYLLAEGTNPGGGKPTSPVCTGPSSLTGIGIQKAGQIFMSGMNLKSGARTYARFRLHSLTAAKQLFPNSCVEFNAAKAAWTAVQVPAQSGEPTCTITTPINDFSFSLNPTSATTEAGQAVTTNLSTTVTSGNAQSITLRASGLPAGTTATFTPATIQSGQTSSLRLATSASTPSGTYQITVTADGADVDKTANFSLTVGTVNPGDNDYSATLDPASANVEAGQSATTTLRTQVTQGSAQSITLSASKLPAGVSVSFSPQSITAGGTSTVTISTTSATEADTYPITINLDGATVDRTASFNLTVGGTGPGETTWKEWTNYTAGQTVTYQGVSYRCLQSHTSLPGWEPPNVPALWARV
ncbi:zinc metalloprotease [Sphaerisporangium krabiense]|uniref:Zn-dependent metalloprotease n=1 Tax=Sphaerisporangium krabiense TaxID=763782 RepID=A0A7W8Z2L0_9ACTN|nr:M4 family metallopeptidase [Sphaerisporangium krabiense]MBB5626261.1 Zn-dependent metalloprotease [Sphaerisporangium krabiense]GII66073.1 zinc metalloprotease [Sphaerisporangium krabiense]